MSADKLCCYNTECQPNFVTLNLTLFSGVCESPDRSGECEGPGCSPAGRLEGREGRQGTCRCSSSDEVSQSLSRCWVMNEINRTALLTGHTLITYLESNKPDGLLENTLPEVEIPP